MLNILNVANSDSAMEYFLHNKGLHVPLLSDLSQSFRPRVHTVDRRSLFHTSNTELYIKTEVLILVDINIVD